MEIISTPIQDLMVIKPTVFEDDRGYFFESHSAQKFEEKNLFYNFVQDNQSKSNKGVLRGLHYQIAPFAQTKLVRVIAGSVFDVAVDIRENSPSFGQHYCLELTAANKLMLLIPHGFAHGFLTLEDNTIFSYKCDNYYSKGHEEGIMYNNSSLNIPWPKIDKEYIISEKDLIFPKLEF